MHTLVPNTSLKTWFNPFVWTSISADPVRSNWVTVHVGTIRRTRQSEARRWQWRFCLACNMFHYQSRPFLIHYVNPELKFKRDNQRRGNTIHAGKRLLLSPIIFCYNNLLHKFDHLMWVDSVLFFFAISSSLMSCLYCWKIYNNLNLDLSEMFQR